MYIPMIVINYCVIQGGLTFVDQFTTLRFMATRALLAARHIRILLMNQYA
jgi:hypothetical protein